jgi:hypothetical protein
MITFHSLISLRPGIKFLLSLNLDVFVTIGYLNKFVVYKPEILVITILIFPNTNHKSFIYYPYGLPLLNLIKLTSKF